MRVLRWVLGSVLGWTLLWGLVGLSLTLGLSEARGRVAIWAPLGLCFGLGCLSTWLRMAHRGELQAMDAGGERPARVAGAVFVLGLVLQVAGAVVPGDLPQSSSGSEPGVVGTVQRSIHGGLWLPVTKGGLWLPVDGPLQSRGAGPPPGFRPWPRNEDRYRRQAMLRLPLRISARDPVDPCGRRLLAAFLSCLIPAWCFTRRQPSLWLSLALPFLLLL